MASPVLQRLLDDNVSHAFSAAVAPLVAPLLLLLRSYLRGGGSLLRVDVRSCLHSASGGYGSDDHKSAAAAAAVEGKLEGLLLAEARLLLPLRPLRIESFHAL